jgi:hypothetical protein
MKLGGSLGKVPPKMKKLTYTQNCTLENGLPVRNISSFITSFFHFWFNVTL